MQLANEPKPVYSENPTVPGARVIGSNCQLMDEKEGMHVHHSMTIGILPPGPCGPPSLLIVRVHMWLLCSPIRIY